MEEDRKKRYKISQKSEPSSDFREKPQLVVKKKFSPRGALPMY